VLRAMQFEHDTLLASARMSGRSLEQEWKAEVHQGREGAFAGGYDQNRPRATRQFAQKHTPPEYSVAGTHAGAASDVWAPDRKTRFQSTATVSFEHNPRQRQSAGQRAPLEQWPGMHEGEHLSGDLAPGPTVFRQREYSNLPTAEEELRKLVVTNERYVDGDRTTEIYPASEWMHRADANPLVQQSAAPPKLPRHSARDHLSDRNRTHSLYDPAQPQVTTVVRVTRRQTMDGCDAESRRNAMIKDQQATTMRDIMRQQQAQQIAAEAAEANELLELYSMGIRGVLNGTDATSQPGDKAKANHPMVTRSQSAMAHEEPAKVEASPAAAVFNAREAAARAMARTDSRANLSDGGMAPVALKQKLAESEDLSWVGGISPVPIKAATRPPNVPLAFPPGTFDIRDPESAHKLKQAQRFAPCRASG